MNSKLGPLLVRSTFSMRLYSMPMLGVYLRLNMGYFGEWNYLNKASSSLLDLCCLSLSTCEINLLLLLCTYS